MLGAPPTTRSICRPQIARACRSDRRQERSRENCSPSAGPAVRLPPKMSARSHWRRGRLRRRENPRTLDAGRVGLLLRARRAGADSFPYLRTARARPNQGFVALFVLALAVAVLWLTLSR